jgi:F0F1-type ATP synthase assembly protein I
MGKKKKYKSAVYRSLAVITQFGINMLVPIFLCSFAGLYIDKKLGTGFWFVVLFFVGALAGFRNIYILAKKIYEGDKDGNKRD